MMKNKNNMPVFEGIVGLRERISGPVMQIIHEHCANMMFEAQRKARDAGVINLNPIDEPEIRIVRGGHKGTVVWGNLRIIRRSS